MGTMHSKQRWKELFSEEEIDNIKMLIEWRLEKYREAEKKFDVYATSEKSSYKVMLMKIDNNQRVGQMEAGELCCCLRINKNVNWGCDFTNIYNTLKGINYDELNDITEEERQEEKEYWRQYKRAYYRKINKERKAKKFLEARNAIQT